VQVLKCGGCHHSTPGLGKVAGFYVFFSAPGLKVPVGLGFLTHALEGGSSHKISPLKFTWYRP